MATLIVVLVLVVLLVVAVTTFRLPSSVLAALIGAAVAGIVSVALTALGSIERQRVRKEGYLIDGLRYFEGGTQKRNIGVSIVESLWQTAPGLRSLVVPLLVGQAIYLLSESKQSEAAHELNNLERIMALVVKAVPEKSLGADYERLLEVMDERITISSKEEGGVSEEVPRSHDELVSALQSFGKSSRRLAATAAEAAVQRSQAGPHGVNVSLERLKDWKRAIAEQN